MAGSPYIVPHRVKRDALELLAAFHGRQEWPESCTACAREYGRAEMERANRQDATKKL